MSETQLLLAQLGALSYIGIWGISFLANVVVPVPEEAILLGLGYVVGSGTINGWLILPIVISAVFASDCLMYYFSRIGARPVTWFFNKFFAKRVEKHQEWLDAHINKVIFFSRFLVQLRFIGPFLAGQKRVSFKTFATYDLAAIFIYVPLFIFLGWFFHNKVKLIIDGIGTVKNIILIVAGLGLAFWFSKFIYSITLKKYLQK